METAIYCRVSTEEQAQEGFSIRAQEQKLKEYASVKDWSVYNIYIDEGISGKNITERPAINRMIADIEAGHVKNVLVFKLDRLTRSVADLVYLIDLFKKGDCAFNSLMESLDTSTASGRMFIKIIGIFAEFERENIAERVRVGKERKAREGYSNSSRYKSYGYDQKKGQKVQTINEQEAQNVRMIFDMYVKRGMSLSAIVQSLNMQNIPSKCGGHWHVMSVRQLLTNCNYIGSVRYSIADPSRYFETEGHHEAIISEEIFREAQVLIEKNKKVAPTKKPYEKNYFVNFLYCAECGEKLVAHNTVTTRADGTYLSNNSFMCAKRIARACKAKSAVARKIERALIEYFAHIEDMFLLDSAEAEKQENERQDNAAQVKAYQDRMRQLESKEKEVMSFYIRGDIDFESYRGLKKQLDGDRDFIRAELERLEVNDVSDHPATLFRENIIADFRENWEHLTNTEKRLFLTHFIKKIVVRNAPIEGSKFGNTMVTAVEFNEY